jgi:hypothetical protein
MPGCAWWGGQPAGVDVDRCADGQRLRGLLRHAEGCERVASGEQGSLRVEYRHVAWRRDGAECIQRKGCAAFDSVRADVMDCWNGSAMQCWARGDGESGSGHYIWRATGLADAGTLISPCDTQRCRADQRQGRVWVKQHNNPGGKPGIESLQRRVIIRQISL